MSSRPTDAIPLALPGNARPPSSRRRWLGVRSYWLCQAAGWGGLLTLMAGPLPLKALASGAEFAALLLFCVTGLLLSHLLRVAITKALDASRTWGGLILRILPWFAFIPAVHAIIQVAWAKDVLPHSTAFMNSFPGRDPVLFAFVDIFSFSTGIFATWTGFYFGLIIQRHHHETRIDRLELAAHIQEAAWQELRAQLNPHFLFNSLNSIRALIPRDHTAPRDAVMHLSELLRSSLALKQDELIPLHRELETVDSFLALESLRFEQRLRVVRSVEEGTLGWLVPPFLVQILVENAVKYGVAPYEGGGDIELRIGFAGENLRVEVFNRGVIGRATGVPSTGIGLANIRARLALLFGASAILTLENSGPDRIRARALVPPHRLRPATPPNPAT